MNTNTVSSSAPVRTPLPDSVQRRVVLCCLPKDRIERRQYDQRLRRSQYRRDEPCPDRNADSLVERRKLSASPVAEGAYPEEKREARRLGIPAFENKLVQEVVRMILKAIYEGHFETTSHGFRPKRSCHTALLHIQKTFSGAKWFIEGDIKGFFDNIDHDVLVGILRERISDDRFIRLIRKFLKAGYVEDWTFHNTYSGMPQGGIVSPILANIYLDKLDKYVKEYIRHFDMGTKRRPGKESNDLANERKRTVRKLKKVKDGTEKAALVARLKAIEREHTSKRR